MIKILLPILATLALVLSANAQSPNIQSAATRADLSVLQSRTERGQNGGYPPLGTYVAPLSGTPVVDPRYLFPGFAGASDNTIWVKSGSDMVALTGIAFSSGNATANNVFIGDLGSSLNGIKIATGSNPLFLKGGSGAKVMVAYNQSIGGSDSGGTAFTWSIGPSGTFSLGGGQLSGALDMNSHAISEITTAAGSVLTVNFATPTLTSSSGNITMSAPAGAGVVVPSTADDSHTTFALNVTSATTLFGRKDQTNTWSDVQTFSVAPVVPNSSFSIAKVTSLQTSLDAALKRDGSNAATGNLNAGTYRIINVGTPSASGDAVPLGYLTSNYVSNPVSTLSATAPLTASAATGAVTIAIPVATNSVDGYLSSSDRTRFANASAASSWTDGQLMIGNTSTGAATKAALTAGAGVVITNGNGSISLATSAVSTARTSVTLDSKTSTSNVASTSPTSLYSYTVPAGALAAGDTIHYKISGNFILEGGQTISVVFSLGGSTLFTMSLPGSGFTPSSSEVPYEMDIEITVRTAGVSGTAAAVGYIKTPTSTIFGGSSTLSIDTTITRVLNTVFTISAITGGNHINVMQGTVRQN